MMRIAGSSNSYSISASRIQGLDAASQDGIVKAIQKQMSNVQNQMRGISSNQEMTRQEKELAKKELKEHLQSLNDQLNQRKAELKNKKASGDAQDFSDVDQSIATMEMLLEEDFLQGVLNADSTIKRVSAARIAMLKMKARVRTLETEIQLDGARGISTAKKEELLSTIRSRMLDISSKLNDRKTADASRGVILKSPASQKEKHDEAKKDKDRVIIQLETRTPLKVTKVWYQKKGRLLNIKL